MGGVPFQSFKFDGKKMIKLLDDFRGFFLSEVFQKKQAHLFRFSVVSRFSDVLMFRGM